MLRKGLQALGGLERLLRPDDSILIKPNLVLRESDPKSPLYPTMSSPDVVRELIYLARVHTSIIRVGDQGGEDQEAIYQALDLYNAVVGSGADLLNFEQPPELTRPVRLPTWEASVPDFKIFQPVYDASVVINLCNLKRHSSAYMTGAIKNCIGAMQGRWDAGTRGWLHRNPNLSNPFLQEVAHVAALINPELTIVDARDIMVGNGPLLSFSGARIQSGVNRMIMSGDLLAMDAYCAQRILQDHDPDFTAESLLPTWEEAAQLGLGTSDLSRVDVLEIDESWEPQPKKGGYRR
jgi:uncharacterized protein (DUF362 family)